MLLNLPVLPPPFSTSLFPELDRPQRREWRKAMFARNPYCQWCGRRLNPEGNKGVHPTLDHVHPTNRGGTNPADNFALSCFACNGMKANRDPHELLVALESACQRVRPAIAFDSVPVLKGSPS